MPIILDKNLPAFSTLKKEDVFVMSTDRAENQDIRPMRIGLLNLMPRKEATEIQFFRMIGNGPLQIEAVLLAPKTHSPKNTSVDYLDTFYQSFENIKKIGLDGLIVTGAPVEHLPFEEVTYWDELKEIMDWAQEYIASTLFICWSAQAALYHFYNIPKIPRQTKISGVFKHFHHNNSRTLLRGMDDVLWIPHSMHTRTKREDVEKKKELKIVIESKIAGLHLLTNRNASQVFAMGHYEYDRDTLDFEYQRDAKESVDNVDVPYNYYPDDDPKKIPRLTWRANGRVFYQNWINHVYQKTPFELRHEA